MGDGGNNDDGYTLLTEADKDRIANTVFAWQSPDKEKLYHNVPEFCYSATNEEIEIKSFNLAPSKYIQFIDHDIGLDYTTEMRKIQMEMQDLLVQDRQIQAEIVKAFKEIGYAVE